MTSGGHNKDNLIGQSFNKLTVIEYIGSNNRQLSLWKCICDCGNYKETTGFNLKQNRVRSCGCQNYRLKGSSNPKWKGFEEISGTYFKAIQNGARSRNIEFNITMEYIWEIFIKQNKKCALTGLGLSFKDKHKGNQTASLDRIDSLNGYVEGNVQWLHKDVNSMKMNFSESYLYKLCKLIVEKNNGRFESFK